MFFGVRSFVASVLIVLFCFGLAACGSGEGGIKGFDEPDASAAPDMPGPDEPVPGEVAVCGLSGGCDISDVSYIREMWGEDDYVLNDAEINGDILTLNVSYSGGCEEHVITLVISESFVETEPVQLAAFLAHDGNGDSCERWVTETYAFDLGVIKTLYQEAYQQNTGRVVLLLGGIGIPEERRIDYEFGS